MAKPIAYDLTALDKPRSTKLLPGTDGAPYLDPSSAALRGLAGDFVRTYERFTEADPAALLGNFLVMFGAGVGSRALANVGEALHPPALYVAIVGRSAKARKGTATNEMSGLMHRVDPDWFAAHTVSGFGSGEAFIAYAAEQEGGTILLVEPEFGRVLTVTSREHDTTSTMLRQAWDYHPLQLRTRTGGIKLAPATPTSIIAHITAEELTDARYGLRPVQILNGFGNRVLWNYADRRRLDPNPQIPPLDLLGPLADSVRGALVEARERRDAPIRRTPQAQRLWEEVLYGRLGLDDPGGPIGALTARAESQVLRLSLIYSLLDCETAIDSPHLKSAWEFWRYCRWSAQHIWVGDGTGDPSIDRVKAILDGGASIDGKELDRMFRGHVPRNLRERLVKMGAAKEFEVATGGRPSKVLRAAKSDPKPDGHLWWTRVAFRREGT